MGGYSKVLILIVVAIIAILLQNLRTRYYDYKCSACNEKFSISTFAAIFSIHLLGKKLIKCPKCGKVMWAETVLKNK